MINRILTNEDREIFKPIIEQMFSLCPEIMARKIAEANVQQAFTLSTALGWIESDEDVEILSAGAFEDSATEILKKLGYKVTDVDPAINSDLHTFAKNADKKFDIIISTSVVEHVEDDEEFITDICNLLKPQGLAILTMDFNNNYKVGDPVPATVIRQYTEWDLHNRLWKLIEKNNCFLQGLFDWSAEPDFIYQGYLYSFATFVFRKSL